MKNGRIELTIGPMFAGKTSWLIEKLEKYSSENVVAVKSFLDDRYSNNEFITHDKKRLKATAAKDEKDILNYLREKPNASVLGLDELQFFKPTIAQFFKTLKDKNITIFVAGLNVDHKNDMWDATEATIKVADKVNRLTAICSVCGKKNATITNRKGRKGQQVIVGGSELYEPLCMNDYLSITNGSVH